MASLVGRLPRGARLSDESWIARHAILIRLLWLHVPALVLLGVLGPMPLWEAGAFPLVVAVLAVAASAARTKRAKAELTSLGLISATFVAIELSGGSVSAHLHLFGILIFVALYQQWAPLLWAIAVVVVHHGLVGLVAPERVFGMSMDFGSTLLMVAVHAGSVVFAVVGIIAFWYFAEASERAVETLRQTAEQEHRGKELADQRVREDRARERVDAAEVGERAVRAIADAAQIGDGARTAIEAVSAVNEQLTNLTSAVHDVAQRANQAAGLASSGQDASRGATDTIRNLERSVSEIADVNALIAQLAKQTNLLALNATIEAARAGDAGLGFGIVASEVKELATATSTSVSRVNEVITAIVGETEQVTQSFAATNAAVGEIQASQLEIATSVEEQAVLLADVARQLSTATTAAQGVLVGLNRLTATTEAH